MSEMSLSNFDPRYRDHVDKAVKAIENGKPTYVIAICSALLDKHPECLEVRKVLRKAHLNLSNNRDGIIAKIKSTAFSAFKRLRGWSLLRHPNKSMIFAERWLESNPHDILAYRFLARAAMNLQLFETAIFAYESISDRMPEDKQNLLDLGNTLYKGKHYREAINIGTRVLNLNPSNGEANSLVKRASVAHSIEKVGWDGESNFQSKLQS